MVINEEVFVQVEKAFQVSEEQLGCFIVGIQEEMKRGLEVDCKPSELRMIPSFVRGKPTGEEKGTYLALEISGMDIYVCRIKLKGEGGKLAINQYQYKIPKDLTVGDEIVILIDYVTECVNDFQQRMGASREEVYSMAISLGFAVLQTSLNRGIIIALEHGFDFSDAIGCDIVRLLDSRLKTKGLQINIVAMANDGVCTLLAHAYQNPSTRVGVIHSAGTNCAYYDSVSNIKQLEHLEQKEEMIINTEWCNFSSRYLPVTFVDRLLDDQSNNPGIHTFEKMTSGMYLGEVVRQVLLYFVKHKVLSFDTELIMIPYRFETSYMYACELDEDELEDTRLILEEIFCVGKTSLMDRRIVQRVCVWVGYRAALLIGAGIAGIVRYIITHIGLDKENGLAIAVSGDVFKDYPQFHLRTCEAINEMIPKEIKNKISVGLVQHSRIIGAAIVAMMAEKMNR